MLVVNPRQCSEITTVPMLL